MNRQRRRARQQPAQPPKGLRRVHAVCAVVVLLSIAGFCMALGPRPPVPITGEPRATVLGASAGVFLVYAALVCWLIKDAQDRITAGITALLSFGLTMGVTVPDVLYRLNSWHPATSPQVDVQERFVLLAEHTPSRSLDYFVLHTVPGTKPAELPQATPRHITRPQYEALKAAALHPGQAVRLSIVQGRLGWAYVRAITPQ